MLLRRSERDGDLHAEFLPRWFAENDGTPKISTDASTIATAPNDSIWLFGGSSGFAPE